jgi:mannose-6-phosphate isomerase-like protein (cupin superfamily)
MEEIDTQSNLEKFTRPWGYYQNIYGNDTSGYKVKKIVVNPKQRLSLQTHKNRSEHWVLTKGTAKVQVGTDIFTVSKGIHIYIPTNTLHRITNIGDEEVIMIETQIGDYLGEDDIIRYEDDYGRSLS